MKIVKTNVQFSTKHPIVDIEISNDISLMGWKYSEAKISIVGFFVGTEITQFLLTDVSKLEDFRRGVKDFLLTIDKDKIHAFNTEMENGCFSGFLGICPTLHEIKPFSGKGANKEYFFKYLIKTNKVEPSSIKFADPLNGNSGMCISSWQNGEYEDVRLHNICCLLKEAKILAHRDFIKEQFSSILDGSGWIKKDVFLQSL